MSMNPLDKEIVKSHLKIFLDTMQEAKDNKRSDDNLY